MNALGYPLWVVTRPPDKPRLRLAVGYTNDGFGRWDWLLASGSAVAFGTVDLYLDEHEAKATYEERKKTHVPRVPRTSTPAASARP